MTVTCPHLDERRGTLYFRIKVPRPLRSALGYAEIRRSLHTDSVQEAHTVATFLTGKINRIFLEARKGMLTPERMKELVNQELRKLLELHEIGQNSNPWPLAEEDITVRTAGLVESRDAMEKALKANSLDIPPVRMFMGQVKAFNKDADLIPGSAEYVELARLYLRAAIEAHKTMLDHVHGKYDGRLDAPVLAAPRQLQAEAGPAADARTKPTKAAPEKRGPRLKDLVRQYEDEHVRMKKWTGRSEFDYRTKLKPLLDHFGKRDITTLTHQDLLAFRDEVLMQKLSQRQRTKPKDGESKAPKPVLISPATVRGYCIRIGCFFNWAAEHEFIAKNIAAKLTPSMKVAPRDQRHVYSAEDIKRILTGIAKFRELGPYRVHKFWVPMIALLSGMRQNEICQLYVEDVQEIKGIPCFRVCTDSPDQRVKTEAGGRTVPIHPLLVELGFLDYVANLSPPKNVHLWPGLKPKRDGYGQSFQRWYGRFNREKVTDDPKKTFHSLRHTVTNNLVQQGHQDSQIADLVGHAQHGETVARYGKGLETPGLLKLVESLDFGIDIKLTLEQAGGKDEKGKA